MFTIESSIDNFSTAVKAVTADKIFWISCLIIICFYFCSVNIKI